MERYIFRHKEGKTEVLDAATGKPAGRMIKSLNIKVDDPIGPPKAVVECLDIGFDVELPREDIEFKTSLSMTLRHEERAHIVGALEAAKALVQGGDSRTAMLKVAAACNEAKVKISTADVFNRILERLRTPPPPQDAPEEEPDSDPVVEERILPKEPPAQPHPQRPPAPKQPQSWTPQVPAQQVPPLQHGGDDPLKGSANTPK
jgi:hypothetical protein